MIQTSHFPTLDTEKNKEDAVVTDTEAMVLRQVKTLNGRRMLLLFTKKFGKISVGTSATEGGRNKSALAVRPFTYGRYELFKGRESYNLNNGQVIKSYYGLGEDLDKYMAGSYVLELTEKLLPEELAQPRMFSLLLDFFDALERRQKKHDTLVMAYMVKALDIMGTMPGMQQCGLCGADNPKRFFSVEEGGMICPSCAEKLMKEHSNEPLIYDADFDIINILRYFQKEPFASFEKLSRKRRELMEIEAKQPSTA